ncbi:hypothetical protein GFD21_02285 [Bifidobacterium sp. SMA15]|uniref:Uncharacterized protein n=2 Tax=Bifidobacterium platyrrhinorum TaxID=2661628 RepID=A0A6L9SQ35_9BIFI|nr:hypothetical protein [Bifidobacterium platyrrhinorum]
MEPQWRVVIPSSGFVHGRTPPVYEGTIEVGLSDGPVPYRVVAVADDGATGEEIRTMAVSTCRVVCLAVDVIRGNLPSSALSGAVSAPCLSRLETLAYLLSASMTVSDDMRAAMRFMPVVPHLLSGMLVNASTLEMAAHLSVGRLSYWANVRLELRGSRWMCTVVDVG